MGGLHLRCLAQILEAQVVAVVDPHLPAAEKAAEAEGVRAFADVADMLSAVAPQYVVVASPPRFHAEQCIAAFQAGAHGAFNRPVHVAGESGFQATPGRFTRVVGGSKYCFRDLLYVAHGKRPFE